MFKLNPVSFSTQSSAEECLMYGYETNLYRNFVVLLIISLIFWLLLPRRSSFSGSIIQGSLRNRALYQITINLPIMFNKFNFGYSLKNISLPSQKEYVMQLIFSVETFVKNLRWRSHFFLNPQEKPSKETYGFKSLKAAPKLKSYKS